MEITFDGGHTKCDTCSQKVMKLAPTPYGYVPVCKNDERFICVPMINRIKKNDK